MSRRITTQVRIGGITTPIHAVSCTFDVEQPVATGSLTLSAPRPAHIQIGAPVVIHAGYDGAVLPIFNGRVADHEAAFSESGGILRVEMEGHAQRLFYTMYRDLGYNGPMSLQAYVRSLCNWRGVPHYLVDSTFAPDGDVIMLASNADTSQWIPLDRGTSPGALIQRYGELFGYRGFDTPDGTFRFQSITGLPHEPLEDMPLYQEGVNVLSISRSETLDEKVNYWEAKGLKYEAPDGSEVAVRSIPVTIERDDRLGPDGVNQRTISDDALVADWLARHSRNAHEINYGEEYVRYRWQATGDPERTPGEAVALLGPRVRAPSNGTLIGDIIAALPRSVWLMRVAHTISDGGWTTDMEGWAGSGQLVTAGNDCVTQTLLGSGGVHLGTEYLSHYRRPNPDGRAKKIPFTVDKDYSTLTIRGYGHGVNSFIGNTQTEVSRFEIWQPHDTERAVASGDMPRLNENLERRLPYSQDRYWEKLVIPLTGSLKAGNAELRIISELDKEVGDYDDYEVRSLVLSQCGIGTPTIIGA